MNARYKRAASEVRSIVWLVLLSQLAACGGGGMSNSSAPPPPPPPPPPVATFTVHPKYLIGSVIYVPPGPGSSVTYGFGTMLGTTVSTASSWSKSSSAGPQIGVDAATSIAFGNVFGGATADSVDMGDTFTNLSAPFAEPPADTLNHDYDQVVLFFGVDVNAAVDSAGTVTWSMDFSQVQKRGFLPQGYIITVGCFNPSSGIYSSCASVRNFLTDPLGQFQLTSGDLANIVAADPYADPTTAPQTIDPARYVVVYSFSYFASPVQSTSTLTLNNNFFFIGNSKPSTYSYSVAASTSASYDGVSLKDPTAFTWTNSSAPSNQTGSSQGSIVVAITSPSAPGSGGTLFMYQDTVYKTFMFSFTPPPR